MNSELITVIVPVYNTAKYLPRCVNSILNQTYSNIEIILIDDGSTDGSGYLCDRFGAIDSRIHVMHKKNGGQALARNDALDISSGQFILFVDSDDYIDNRLIEIVLTSMNAEKAQMAVFGVINDHGFIKKSCPSLDSAQVWTTEELMASYLSKPFVRSILCNKMYSADLWKDIRFPNARAREDELVLYKIYARCQKSIYLNQNLYFQFIRPGSIEQSKFNMDKLKSIDCAIELTNFVNKVYPSISYLTELKVANAYHGVIREIASDKKFKKNSELYKELLDKMRDELNAHKIHHEVNNRLYDELEDICNNQNKFLAYCKNYRRKYSFINNLKKILSKLHLI